MSAFTKSQPEKLCWACFTTRFPDRKPGTMTWGRECTQCHKPTPTLSTLVKIEPQEADSD